MLLQNNFQVVCLAPDDPFSELLCTLEGVTFIPLRRLSRKSLSPLGNFYTFLEITRLLRREKPALALFYTIKPNIFGGLAAWISGTTAIANIEGMGYAATAPGFFRRLVFVLYRFAFRFVKKVVFLNDDDRAVFLKQHVVAPDKTQVIKGTGIDVHHFSPPETQSQEPVFLFVGRLLSDKGIREFETAAAQVKAAFPRARFQILGNIDPGNPASIQSEELQQWIEKQCIEYLGQSDDVRPFISAAAVVVLPSYREGIPRVAGRYGFGQTHHHYRYRWVQRNHRARKKRIHDSGQRCSGAGGRDDPVPAIAPGTTAPNGAVRPAKSAA
jgi:glycosyltransferase involved in cell wall biosynthesis